MMVEILHSPFIKRMADYFKAIDMLKGEHIYGFKFVFNLVYTFIRVRTNHLSQSNSFVFEQLAVQGQQFALRVQPNTQRL